MFVLKTYNMALRRINDNMFINYVAEKRHFLKIFENFTKVYFCFVVHQKYGRFLE